MSSNDIDIVNQLQHSIQQQKAKETLVEIRIDINEVKESTE